LSDEALQVLRLRALRGIELGYSELDLGELLGVCHETISRWWTAYVADGLSALPGGRSGRPLGSGRFLSDQQTQRTRACLPAVQGPACPGEVACPAHPVNGLLGIGAPEGYVPKIRAGGKRSLSVG
jgi:hypothetical protein